jgi:Icc-related predicted phosphoesterase
MLIGKAFSDGHGNLPIITDEFDLLVIAGDITPAQWGYYNPRVQKEWLLDEFKTWVENLPFKNTWSKVFLVPGNHDCLFENLMDGERIELEHAFNGRVKILIHEEYIFDAIDDLMGERNIRIFGTPYCKVFGNWAFMRYDSFLTEKFNEIPEGIDILITHDPPALNDLGKISQGRQRGKQAGNEILAKRLLEVKPKHVFAGHIHSGNHKYEEYEGMLMANVALVDESYDPVNNVLTFYI